jgi:hypothetical protein
MAGQAMKHDWWAPIAVFVLVVVVMTWVWLIAEGQL